MPTISGPARPRSPPSQGLPWFLLRRVGIIAWSGLVEDEMNVEAVWNGAVGEIQEPPELIGPVSFGEVCDHLARCDVERCVEVCRAVAHVVVALAFKNARSHREDRLGPVERLDLESSHRRRARGPRRSGFT